MSPDDFVTNNSSKIVYRPAHQIRLPLVGDMIIGKNLKLKEGYVRYFPEGLPYGPQDDGDVCQNNDGIWRFRRRSAAKPVGIRASLLTQNFWCPLRRSRSSHPRHYWLPAL